MKVRGDHEYEMYKMGVVRIRQGLVKTRFRTSGY